MNNQDEGTRFIRGSGNVFADMGLPDADEQLAKAQIAAQIARLIAERDMTQREVAAVLGVTQPQVSALLRGHWEGISLDKLSSGCSKRSTRTSRSDGAVHYSDIRWTAAC